jgi:hypothetical protein
MLDNDTSANTTMRCAEDPSFWDRSQPWSEHLPCSPPFAPININYAWSTHLFLKEDENIGGKNVVREAKWVNAVARFNSSIVVINTGIHYHPDMPSNVLAAISHIVTTHPNVSVMYRFSPPGHVGCETEFHAPPLLVAQNDSLYAEGGRFPPNHRTRSYRWFDVVNQNHEVAHMLRSRFPQVLQLNVVSSTALRIDQHVIKTGRWIPEDCLHYCIPGPIDQWVTFFFNALDRIARF